MSIPTCINAQGLGDANSARVYVPKGSIPVHLDHFLNSAGDRFGRPGRERMTLTGTIADGRNSGRATLVWEHPGLFRLESGSRVATFDGQTHKTNGGSLSEAEQDQIESLVGDSLDFFLFTAANGVRARLLGRRFRADDGRSPNYRGPLSDILLMMHHSSVRPDRQARSKMYYFDSITGRLSKVAYLKPGGVRVETVFDEWTIVDGQPVPGTITRREGANTQFTFRLSGAGFGPRGPGAPFITP